MKSSTSGIIIGIIGIAIGGGIVYYYYNYYIPKSKSKLSAVTGFKFVNSKEGYGTPNVEETDFVTYSWNPVEGATEYIIYVYDDQNNITAKYHTANTQTEISETYKYDTVNHMVKEIRYKIAAVNSDGEGPLSSVLVSPLAGFINGA